MFCLPHMNGTKFLTAALRFVPSSLMLSELGSLLFIIYIDGLTNVLSNCSVHLYADDLLRYRPIHSPTDYQALQADIDALSDWISAHKLQFNCDKCKCMLVS